MEDTEENSYPIDAPATRQAWASLIHNPGWHHIVLPLITEEIATAERLLLDAYDTTPKRVRRLYQARQRVLRELLTKLRLRAEKEFDGKIAADHIAANAIATAFTVPKTYRVQTLALPATGDTAVDPYGGTENNPFSGPVEPHRPPTPPAPPASV